MASVKRKAAPGGQPSPKAAKTEKNGRPSKARSDEATKSEARTAKIDKKKEEKSEDAASAKSTLVSKLKAEEPLFPRGGGSVLSPLEHKQIQIQAKKDVLFEQASGAATKNADKLVKHKKKRKSSTGAKAGKKEQGEDSAWIESLNYKKLVKGSLVLGQVCEINALEVSVALPNNLTGHVAITAVSPGLTRRLETEAEEDEDMSGEDDVDLKSIFRVGQYVRAHVNSVFDESATGAAKPRRRIELSLHPELANVGLAAKDVVENSTVMASVASVEDHGYVMDLGIADSDLRGFLSLKEVDSSTMSERLQPGAPLLCVVTTTNGKVAQLSTQPKRLGSVKAFPSKATTINTFLPGTMVDVLLSEVSSRGIVGKVMGHLDVTADLIHSGAGPKMIDLEQKFKVGSKVKARVICNFPTAEEPKLGVSLLDHILSLEPKTLKGQEDSASEPLSQLPMSTIIDECTVLKVEADIGLWVDVGLKGAAAFVHISHVKDGKVDTLFESSGPYKVGSVHRGRVLGYNALDGVFQLSFEKSVLEQRFLRVDDIPIGEVVNGTIEKLIIDEQGVGGLLVSLSEGVTGFVHPKHMADVQLQHPEKKFREGMKVKARVLSKDPAKRQFRLTLKKTLVNSETPAIHSFDQVTIGMQTVGSLMSIKDNGAVVQFYGSLRGFLPVAEMSEAFIRDPREHFRVGQVVSVRVTDFDVDAKKLLVSCKDPSSFSLEKQLAYQKIKLGDVLSGKVTEKTEDDVTVELTEGSLKATVPLGHLTDKSTNKEKSAHKRMHIGQTLSELVVLEKNDSRRSIILSQKPSLVAAAKEGKLPTSIDEAVVGSTVHGFVCNMTPTAAFIQFAGRLVTLLPKSLMLAEAQELPDFGLHKFAPVEVEIISAENGRLVASMPGVHAIREGKAPMTEKQPVTQSTPALKPLDKTIKNVEDVSIGMITKARITAVKETQLNVELADNIHGRIDISMCFDKWEEIDDPKDPLKWFHEKGMVKVRVIGHHDARNRNYLRITQRSAQSVLELSAKPSDLKADNEHVPLSLDKIEVGASFIGFVNNHGANILWVTLSPTVRGRVYAMDASDDLSQINNLERNFPIGTAMRVRVVSVDAASGRLDLTARSPGAANELTWETVKQNMVLPGKVTKANDRQVMVQLSQSLSGPVHLVDLADDYEQATTVAYSKNDVVRVSIVEIDKSNKRIRLSTRPSRVLNSSLPVEDREVTKATKLQEGDIIRGFVRSVADKGLFVNLGGDVVGHVRIADLSDKFLKDWKEHFQIDQLVKARITAVDNAIGQIQLSLKASVVDEDYVQPVTLARISPGQIVTGKVRKVEEFGAFIVIDGSNNVSGLAHRSQMAEKPVQDATKLYKEGDAVKAKVLSVDLKKQRMSLGLKPSFFEDEDDSDMDVDEDDAGAALLSDDDDDSDEDTDMRDTGAAVEFFGTDNAADIDSDSDGDADMADVSGPGLSGLDAGGFDWSGAALDVLDESPGFQNGDDDSAAPQKKKRKKHEPAVDRTAELDVNGPQTATDYERLLLGQPDSSALWIAYMAFQMQVSELAKAREIAERALGTINAREETEKYNVWIAYLNLEITYGTDETVDAVFKRACQYNDEQEVYERTASTYIQSGKLDKADALFNTLVKKFGSLSPQVWINYAHFLHHSLSAPERGRALLARASQALPQSHHQVVLMSRFAALEFRSPVGDAERGRTIFVGMLDTYPKRFDLWGQLLSLEEAAYAKAKASGEADGKAVRDVFDRGAKVQGLKAKKAKGWFQRWAKWEEENGDAKSRERVSARAREWAAAAERRKKEREEADDEE